LPSPLLHPKPGIELKQLVSHKLDTDAASSLMQFDFDTSIRAIAHPLRRKILEWLKDPALHFPEQEYGQNLGVCVGQITLRCGLSQSTVSRHLTVLKESALIDLHKSGQVHFFKRNEKLIQSLNSSLKKLLQDERFGG
jgi:ArsR family transcriptional regulator